MWLRSRGLAGPPGGALIPPGTTVADYLDALRYRRYCRTVLIERRRVPTVAATGGTDDWSMTAPVHEMATAALENSRIRSRTNLRKRGMAVENYRRWRREQEGADDA